MDSSSDPRRIAVEYNYFGDGEFTFDEDIVRRICWIDPKFVPVFKREVYRYPTGGTRVFKHFGFGVAHEPGMPVIDKAVYAGMKPRLGFLSTLARATGVSIWAQGPPFWKDPLCSCSQDLADSYCKAEMCRDGTPGETVPFDERAYGHAKECDAEMRRLYSARRTGDKDEIPDVPDELRQMATLAYKTQFKEAEAALAAKSKAEKSELRDLLTDNRTRMRDYFFASDSDRQRINELMSDPNPTKRVTFGHRRNDNQLPSSLFSFNPVVRPAAPGSRLVVPA